MSFGGEYAILSDLEAELYLCVTNMFPVTLGCKELPCIQVSEHRAMQRKLGGKRRGGRVPFLMAEAGSRHHLTARSSTTAAHVCQHDPRSKHLKPEGY